MMKIGLYLHYMGRRKRKAGSNVVGERLRQLRTDLGLTQPQFAERLGVDRSMVGKRETGRVAMTTDDVRQIAEEFGISVGWLFGDADKNVADAATPPKEEDSSMPPVEAAS